MDNYRINKLLFLIGILQDEMENYRKLANVLNETWIIKKLIGTQEIKSTLENIEDTIMLINTTLEIDELLKEEHQRTTEENKKPTITELQLKPINGNKTKGTNNKKHNRSNKSIPKEMDDNLLYE